MKGQSWEVTKMNQLGMLCFVCATFAPEGYAALYRGGIPPTIAMRIKREELEAVLSYYLEEMGMEPVVGFNNELLWFATNQPTDPSLADHNPNFDRYWTIAEDIAINSTNNLNHWNAACDKWEAD